MLKKYIIEYIIKTLLSQSLAMLVRACATLDSSLLQATTCQ